MAVITDNIDSRTVQAIYRMYEGKRTNAQRPYLGASMVGRECERSIWYSFRWAGGEKFSGRMLRLFESGNLEEIRIIHNLRAIGCEVFDKDDSGGQFAVKAVGGHFSGHCDAVATGIPEAPKTPHLVEIKTSNARLFAKLKADGVEKAKPEHFAQMQVYMHLMELDRAIYIVCCKDTDELYSERIDHDKNKAQAILNKAERIIRADRAPERISSDPQGMACKFCPHNTTCHGGDKAVEAKTCCRTCCHSQPVIDDSGMARWRCNLHDKIISEQEQERGCNDHLFLPDFIAFADVNNGGAADDTGAAWIEYRNANGKTWRAGGRPGQFKSHELTVLPQSAVADEMVVALKTEFQAEAVECP